MLASGIPLKETAGQQISTVNSFSGRGDTWRPLSLVSAEILWVACVHGWYVSPVVSGRHCSFGVIIAADS